MSHSASSQNKKAGIFDSTAYSQMFYAYTSSLGAIMRPLLLLILALLATSASASPVPPELQKMDKSGLGTIVRSFQAPEGLTGWVVKMRGHYVIIYSMPSGNYVLGGALVGPDGTNLTQKYLDEYAPKPDFAKIVNALRHDPDVVTEGNINAPEIFVYADPNCIFCNILWTELRPYVTSGKVNVHWVLVGFLKDSSAGRAAAILAATDRATALSVDETQFKKNTEEGGIPPLSPIPTGIQGALKKHSQQMEDAGSSGTPTIILRMHGHWTGRYGVPKDMSAFMKTLASN
ncbi:MAG: thiol:disulfide interchange protein DsbG [Acidiferrobacterales bacterium]